MNGGTTNLTPGPSSFSSVPSTYVGASVLVDGEVWAWNGIRYVNNSKIVNAVPLAMQNGFINYTTGGFDHTDQTGQHKATIYYIPIIQGVSYRFEPTYTGNAGVSFYDAARNTVSGSVQPATDKIVPPEGAVFMRLSHYNADGDHSGAILYIECNDTVVNYATVEVPLVWTPGYISAVDGTSSTSSVGGQYQKTSDYTAIDPRKQYIFAGLLGSTAGIAYYDSAKTFIGGTVNIIPTLVPPPGAAFMRLTDSDTSPEKLHLRAHLYALSVLYTEDIPLALSTGYIDYRNGEFVAGADTTYKGTVDYIPLDQRYDYTFSGSFNVYAGIGYYDENRSFIGMAKSVAEELIIPAKAHYIRVSDYDATSAHTKAVLTKIPKIPKQITLNFIGDSVTESMSMDGSFGAVYGKDSYPARVKRFMELSGVRCTARNYGHGGERTPEILFRAGALSVYLNAAVTIPANNTAQGLGVPTVTNGRVSGTKLSTHDVDGSDVAYNINLQSLSHDTNSMVIDGVEYTATLNVGTGELSIAKKYNDGVATTIPAGAIVRTADKMDGIAILFAGINDGTSMTLSEWIALNTTAIRTFSKNCLIIGAHKAIWDNWSDLSGTSAQKYAAYKKAAYTAFGTQFVDMYGDWLPKSIALAQSGGYLQAATAGDITTALASVAAGTIPALLTVDGVAANVHLNAAGYYGFAQVIFRRVLRLFTTSRPLIY